MPCQNHVSSFNMIYKKGVANKFYHSQFLLDGNKIQIGFCFFVGATMEKQKKTEVKTPVFPIDHDLNPLRERRTSSECNLNHLRVRRTSSECD